MYACELGGSFAGGSPCLAASHQILHPIFGCHSDESLDLGKARQQESRQGASLVFVNFLR